MKSQIAAALLAIATLVPSISAQQTRVFRPGKDRQCSTRVLLGKTQGLLNISYGQPEWRSEYSNMFEKLKGRTLRLGKNFWTTFLTSLPITIGGKKIAPGSYVVGLRCDKKGNMLLAMVEASRAMKAGLVPFGEQKWKPDVLVPLALNRDVSKKPVKLMSMDIELPDEDPMNGQFKLSWGPHTLTAPIKIK